MKNKGAKRMTNSNNEEKKNSMDSGEQFQANNPKSKMKKKHSILIMTR